MVCHREPKWFVTEDLYADVPGRQIRVCGKRREADEKQRRLRQVYRGPPLYPPSVHEHCQPPQAARMFDRVMTLGGMSDEQLTAVALHIRARFTEVALTELCARYDLGRLMHLLRYGEGWREHTSLLAECFGLHSSVLRRVARVSEAIDAQDFRLICSLRDPRGSPLSWSHLEVLADIRSPSRRRHVAEAACSGQLTVRQLRASVDGE